jgi:hypothetical protein
MVDPLLALCAILRALPSGLPADSAALGAGLAALQAAPPRGWSETRVDLPNGERIVCLKGRGGDELSLVLDAAGRPRLATWMDPAELPLVFDVADGAFRAEGLEAPFRMELGSALAGLWEPKGPSCCGVPLEADACFCPQCGKRVRPVACSRCGAAIQPEERFCGACGAPVGT